MIEIITEYVVREDHRARLELVFGPGGAWSSLFDAAAGFKGMTLLEVWDSEDHQRGAVADQQAGYDDLLAEMDSWLDARTRLGVFRMRLQGSVRPRVKGRRR